VLTHAFFCSWFQLFIIGFTFKELFDTYSYFCVLYSRDTSSQVFVRFICFMLLHLSMMDTASMFLDYMKFVVNHNYKFEYPGFAFAAA